jgi:bifunctional UDP-N-acetylglucosamine pyrophosphorylase / glucosamine-1-phosphate N-acetyltransferase
MLARVAVCGTFAASSGLERTCSKSTFDMMTNRKTAIVVLAAGLGTRMKSRIPKVMHPIAGRPMIRHLLAGLETLSPDPLVVVVGEEMQAVRDAVAPHPTVVQKERLGTGHAVMAARPALEGFQGDILIVYGDTPLLSSATLARMLEACGTTPRPTVVVLGFRPADAGAYGRLIVDADGMLQAIVEAKEANAEQLATKLCNSGVMAVDAAHLFRLLDRVDNKNSKSEFYLTDIVALARQEGRRCGVVEGCEAELIGVNSRAELALAEHLIQSDLRARAMAAGATLLDPASVFFSHDTRLGQDVVVGPFVVFGPGVTVADGAEILGFCHFQGVSIEAGAQVGPFARLRPGASIGPRAHIGNFVEIKNATVETGAKVNHLTYVGDARVGTGANIGAGTITCNYDGFFKDHTDIGAGAFIGSNSCLVAPVKIGDGAIVGAGSVVTEDVPADALVLTRAPHTEKGGWARSFRERRSAEKAACKPLNKS